MNAIAKRRRGFTLIEILVALVVFAAMAAITWGALSQIARARSALKVEQQRFAGVVRVIGDLERDLRQAIARPTRGQYGEALPALFGAGNRIELSRLGYANPRAEQRSNIERVLYALESNTLRRGREAVLDRSAGSRPEWHDRLDRVRDFRLRYLNSDGRWLEQWPVPEGDPRSLPRAVEFRIVLEDVGELRRVLALPSALPDKGLGANGLPETAAPTQPIPITPITPIPGGQ